MNRSTDEIETWLLERLQMRLGPDSEPVDAHLPFSYYGLDSLDAVALAAELEDWLGEPVSPDVAWDHPTAHAVAVYLGESPEPATEDAGGASASALLAELEES